MDDFDAYAPIFSQPDAVEMTNADAATIDNWVRYKHVLPVRIGNRRLFSFLDLLIIDVTHMLVKTFRVDISSGSYVAKQAAKAYIPGLDADRADILGGRSWHSPIGGIDATQILFTRDVETGGLRAPTDDDSQADSVGVILPVRRIARRLLVGVQGWSARDA